MRLILSKLRSCLLAHCPLLTSFYCVLFEQVTSVFFFNFFYLFYISLIMYQVLHIQKSIPDFKKRNMELLISETHPEVLRAVEVFEVKIINYEHM